MSPSVVRTLLDEVVMAEYGKAPGPDTANALDAQIFDQRSASKKIEAVEVFKGVGQFTSHIEEQNIDSDSPRVDDQKLFTMSNYKKKVSVPVEFFEDEQFGLIGDMMKDVGEKGRTTQDSNAFGLYRDGFSTELTADGAAWFSDTHTNLNGDTIDNLQTAALAGPTQIEALINSLYEQKDQAGVIRGAQGSALLVPTALFKEGAEILDSELIDADNQANYLRSRNYGIRLARSPYLGAVAGGSDTAYFMLADGHSGRRYTRVAFSTSMRDFANTDNDTMEYKARFREELGAVTYEKAVASDGTV